MRYCSRFICSLALFTVFIDRLATLMTTFYLQKHNVASYHNCFISLIVEGHWSWFVNIKLYIFDAPYLSVVRSIERSKLWSFVYVTKSFFIHRSLWQIHSVTECKIGVKMATESQWDIFHLKDKLHTIYRPFEILKLQARKSLRSSYAFALLLSLSWEVTRRRHDHNAPWLEEIKSHSIGC